MSRKNIRLPAVALAAVLLVLLAAVPSPAAAAAPHHRLSPGVLEQLWQWLASPWEGAESASGKGPFQNVSAAEGGAADPLGGKEVVRYAPPHGRLEGVAGIARVIGPVDGR